MFFVETISCPPSISTTINIISNDYSESNRFLHHILLSSLGQTLMISPSDQFLSSKTCFVTQQQKHSHNSSWFIWMLWRSNLELFLRNPNENLCVLNSELVSCFYLRFTISRLTFRNLVFLSVIQMTTVCIKRKL